MLDTARSVKYALRTLNNSVRDTRQVQELTVVALAEATGVSRQTIHSIESGKYVPSVELALKLAKALGTNVEQLFQLEE